MPASSAADETREILHAARAMLADDHFVYPATGSVDAPAAT